MDWRRSESATNFGVEIKTRPLSFIQIANGVFRLDLRIQEKKMKWTETNLSKPSTFENWGWQTRRHKKFPHWFRWGRRMTGTFENI
jgi:hypothetical protein